MKSFPEDIQNEVVTFSKSHLRAYIDEMNDEYDDELEVPYVEEEDFHFGFNGVLSCTHYPAMFFSTGLIEFEPLTRTNDAVQSTLIVYLLVKGWSARDNELITYRISSAFRNMIRENYKLDGQFDECFVDSIQYFDGVGGDDTTKAAQIIMKAINEK